MKGSFHSLSQQNKCGVQWYNIAGPMRGSFLANIAINPGVSPLLGPIGLSTLGELVGTVLGKLDIINPAMMSCATTNHGLAADPADPNGLALKVHNNNLILGGICGNYNFQPNFADITNALLHFSYTYLLTQGVEATLHFSNAFAWGSFNHPWYCFGAPCGINYGQADGVVGLHDCEWYGDQQAFGGFGTSYTNQFFEGDFTHFQAEGYNDPSGTSQAWYNRQARNFFGLP